MSTHRRIKPWDQKELKAELRNVKGHLQAIGKGLSPIPDNQGYVDDTKRAAKELLEDIDEFITRYGEQVAETEVKRVSSLKPKLCDMKLTSFLSQEYGVALPTMGNYGVCDLNSLALRGISVYIKKVSGRSKQFFTLDDRLTALFKSPAVSDPSKTYLELGYQRIYELAAARGTQAKTSASVAEIIERDGLVTMNYSALKILISKFAVDYDVTDKDKYLPAIKELSEVLQVLHDEQKKASK